MMKEAAIVVAHDGQVVHTHLPVDRSSVYLPDDKQLWDVIWENRNDIAGIAHSHPGSGWTGPSSEDLSTFAAIEAGLGRRLIWWIISQDKTIWCYWGSETKTYQIRRLDEPCSWYSYLHSISYNLPIEDNDHD